MGNFCHGDETKNSQMETMGMDACMMIGYHNKVSKKTVATNQSFYSKLENYVHLTYHFF
jgi:D-aminopeptidase